MLQLLNIFENLISLPLYRFTPLGIRTERQHHNTHCILTAASQRHRCFYWFTASNISCELWREKSKSVLITEYQEHRLTHDLIRAQLHFTIIRTLPVNH